MKMNKISLLILSAALAGCAGLKRQINNNKAQRDLNYGVHVAVEDEKLYPTFSAYSLGSKIQQALTRYREKIK